MKYLAFLFCLVFSTATVAQETGFSPPKRWQLTTQTGIDIYEANVGGSQSTIGSKLFMGALTYRLHRHLDVGFEVGYMLERRLGYANLQIIGEGTIDDVLRVAWDGGRGNLFAGLQAKLNYRVGQGDLSFSGAYGLVRHQNRIRVRSGDVFNATVEMSPLTTPYFQFQLGYTYWASKRFGLMIGYSWLNMEHSKSDQNVAYINGNTPRYQIKDITMEGAVVAEEAFITWQEFLGSTHGQYLTLGLVTRLF